MIEILIDTTIIVAVITVLGVVFQSFFAPLLLERLKVDKDLECREEK